MLTTYLKIAVRNFIKEKFFSGINVLGLSVGISVALIITLFVFHELSYDTFNAKHDRIHRIATYLEVGGNGSEVNSTFPPQAAAMQNEIPGIELAVRVSTSNGKIFKHEDRIFTEDKVIFADSGFFHVFDYKVLAGSRDLSLSKPYQILLTPALAKKYFDATDFSTVVGRSILINNEVFEISGVVEEAPANSHMHYSAIASMESTSQGRDRTWNSLNVSLYVLLAEGVKISSVVENVTGVFRKHMPGFDDFAKQGMVMQPTTIPLKDIHLKSNIRGEFEPGGNVMTLYIFGSVALIVLLLASVNFVNLLTARSANRAKEVGVRKVLGSARTHLIRQFILECILLVGVATLLALGCVELLRTPFTYLSGKALPFDLLLTPGYLAALAGFVILLGIAAGSYPAFFLSGFQPAAVLKGKIRSGFKNGRLRNTLVTIQFVISIVLITCTLMVQRQLDFMRSKKLGFDKENVLIIDNSDRLPSQRAFIDALLTIPGIDNAGAATFRPVDDYDGMLITTEDGKDDRRAVNFSRVDDQYLNVLKYEFIDGRNFSREMASDTASVVINERAAELLFGGTALGKKLYNEYEYTVIGVVKDFNFESLKNEVRPLVFYPHPNQRFLHVRLLPGNYQNAIAHIEKIWKSQTSDLPFTYSFLDETYNNLFQEEVKLGNIFAVFTGLGLFIACLGLMGLTAYMAEQRKKEISVRKVLGASFHQVIFLMSKDFLKIMVIATVVAVPLTWYMVNQWLNEFVYRTTISALVLLFGAGAVIITALLAVSYQAVRAAFTNPVDSLKEE
ncbi:MAG TPA: ABC transporter permease [Chryseosolibacter sp.]